MRKYILIASLLFLATTAHAETQTVKVDTAASKVEWVGKKLTGQHNGTIHIKDGEVTIENGKPIGGKFEIDMMSIAVSDLTDPVDNKKLTGHLESSDFFSSNLFPTATFTIKSFAPIANAKAGEPNYTVNGDLSVKGITHSLSFPATVTIADGKASAKAAIVVDRTKYNIRYGSNRFFDNLGNKVIYDNFDVAVTIVGSVS